MARIRSVHPDLHRDKTLAKASASAERTFVRLWCHLDDDGRGEDDPDLLKSDLYPRHRDMDAAAIERDIDELAKLGLVVRYRVGDDDYLCCKHETWVKYQRPQKKKPSDLPGCDDPNAVTRPLRDSSDTDTEPLPPVGEGRGEESSRRGEGEEGRLAAATPPRPKAPKARTDDHSKLFQALVDACGLSPPLTKNEGGRVGTAAKQLVEIGATPSDVDERARAYRKRYGPEVELTPTGLVSNWGQVVASRGSGPRPVRDDACQDCGQTLDGHDAQLCEILARAS